jgi:hypothetical protein
VIEDLTVANWNVRSNTHKADKLDKELKSRKIDIPVILETKKKNKGSKELEEYIIYSGVSSEDWALSVIEIIAMKDWKNTKT